MKEQNPIESFRQARGTLSLFVSEGKACSELLRSNPLAGFCLALNDQFLQPATIAPLATARELVDKPQREILGWLGFRPATEAVAKIGRKCVPCSLNVERCRRFRPALADLAMREMLAHVPRINAGVMALVSAAELRSYLTPSLLSEIAGRNDEDNTESTAETLLDVHEMRAVVRLGEQPPRFTSRQQIMDAHTTLIQELNRPGTLRVNPQAFPPPPFPAHRAGDIQIVPLTSPSALQLFERELRILISAYAEVIREGDAYIYRALIHGEQCAVTLIRGLDNYWRVSQLMGYNNRPVNRADAVVHQWLADVQPPQAPPVNPPTDLPFEFPPPPLPAHRATDVEIAPITNLTDLQILGREQHNCVAAYARRIIAGSTYIYRATVRGEKCTLSLKKTITGKWQLLELKTSCNRPASPPTKWAVDNWIAAVQPNKGP